MPERPFANLSREQLEERLRAAEAFAAIDINSKNAEKVKRERDPKVDEILGPALGKRCRTTGTVELGEAVDLDSGKGNQPQEAGDSEESDD